MSQEQEDEGQMLAGAGPLGMSAEAAERERISQLKPSEAVAKQVMVRHPDEQQIVAAEAAARSAVSAILRAEMGSVRAVVNDLIHDIRTNTEALKLADIPLEQVANSHERASASFEMLRKEIQDIGGRLAGVEQVIDTAGLKTAQRGAEERFNRLADLLENTILELQKLQGGALEAARARLQKATKPRKVGQKRRR